MKRGIAHVLNEGHEAGSCADCRVHYVAHGKKGVLFDCYLQDKKATTTTRKSSVEGWPDIEEHRAKRSTSLDNVTCYDCWKEITALGAEVARSRGRTKARGGGA